MSATAANENFFTFIFIDGTDSSVVTSANGQASYSYFNSGTYKIKIRANLSASQFIEVIDSVTVSFNSGGVNNTGYSTPLNYPNYTLTWQDEFNGTSLSSDWIHEIGNGSWGWGNNELQYYRQQNTTVENGFLTIRAKQENYGGFNYTSSRIITKGNSFHKYGRIDIRAKLPYGQGLWPALWMLGENISNVGWPSCGEIDIMEMIGGNGYNDRTVHGTIHWESMAMLLMGTQFFGFWKVCGRISCFSIIWNQSSINWYRDDIQYHTVDISNLTAFHNNFFFIFNVAVGGNWPGSPDATTVFPQTMIIDYVRVFQ